MSCRRAQAATKREQMKKIEAIVKPFKLEEVKDALGEAGINGIQENWPSKAQPTTKRLKR